MTVFAPTAVRASEFARCPRMAVYRGQGAPAVEPDEQARRYFARGHLYTDYVCRQLEARYGRDDVEREVEIDWPLGTGHADAFIRSQRLLVEIKSTVTPAVSSPMFDMAVQQLAIYLRYFPAAQKGALYLINPSNLTGEDVFTVTLTDDDRANIDAAVARAQAALAGEADLPERVCSRPGQARGRLCAFADHCFHDWEAPKPTEHPDPAAMDAAARYLALAERERPHKAALAELAEEKQFVQAELADLFLEPDSLAGPFRVRRTDVQKQPVFSLKAAKAAGFPVHTLDEFMRPGAAYSTWKVTRAEQAGTVDYGDEAPF